MFEHVPEHRGEVGKFLAGDQQARDLALHPVIDAEVKAIDALTQQYGEELRTTVLWADIKTRWEALKTEFDTHTIEESFTEHTELINEIHDMIRQIADHSDLTHDPDLDTSYLMDLVVIELPLAIESLEDLRDLGATIAAAKVMTPEERVKLSVFVGQLARHDHGVQHAVEVLTEANPEVGAELSPTVTAALAAAETFAQQVSDQLITQQVITIDDQEFFHEGEIAVLAMFKVFDEAEAKFEELLLLREDRLNAELYLDLGISGAGLLLAVLLVFLISRAITGQVGELDNILAAIRAGDFSIRAKILAKDELGQAAIGLNSLLDEGLISSQDERERIQNSIMKLLEDISGVAEGDLTKEAEVTQEITGAIADSFNFMIVELRSVIAGVQETTLSVTSSANEVQTTTEHLATGSEQQSVQIVDTSAAVDEMAVSIQQVSENAESAAKVAQDSLNSAQDGADAVAKTIQGMEGIRQQVQQTAKRIKRLGESSQEIGEIVELIGDIADRTSILALNASIQAAMAGESGRGFAVVAEEVERLAERATESTKRISTLIKSIQSETTEAVAAMEETTREVVGGSGLATEAGKKLGQIQAVSNQLSELIQSISMASKQQARGSESVSKSITEISEVTQQTAAGAKQAAVSIRSLAELADSLRESVGRFKIPEKVA